MKSLKVLFLSLLIAVPSFAQKLEIMIVGSSHDNPPGYDNFDKIVGRLKSFNPDMVFGEYIPNEDLEEMRSDRADAEFQAYKLALKRKEMIDSLQKSGLYRPASEYVTIFFPLICSLGQSRIFPMDCQKYNEEWSRQWKLAAMAFTAMEKKAMADSSSAEAKTFFAIKKHGSVTYDDKRMMSTSEYVNMAHERFSELIDAWNFYGGSKFYGYPGFPDDAVKGMYNQWTLRNEGMCGNILRQAKAMKAKRIVVGVGAAHRKIMEEILARDPTVRIVSFVESPR
ncbi:MAG: hypothetical protein EOP48_04330 [Sphingobacteriales bacterium]|nr:MAG: hypothetical protein EOP48_04330 [Sphingobacteriales bacterium]